VANDGINLDLTGENVRPETLDARVSLGLAVALLEAVIAVGGYEDASGEAPFFLAMTEMNAASVHLAFKPAATHERLVGAPAFAAFQHAAKRLPVYLRGHERVPKELVKPIDRLRQAARAMPEHVDVNARFLDQTVSLSELVTPEVRLITSAETLRAFIIRAGGGRPRVQLRIAEQKSTFTANIAKELVASDEFHVYREAEVAGIFQRDPRAIGSPIVFGEVTHVRFMEKLDRVAAFDRWNEATGRPWKGVEDVEEELRRRGPH
jgi:hypothetical protein